MAALLLVNPRSGGGGTDRLVAAARERGLEVHVLAAGEDPAAVAAGAAAEVLGMAGGDGSLAAVAAVAARRDLPFVCVPAGTRNHFARDLGLDRDDPVAALAAFDRGVERRVDLAFAGDRPFLNNVSLGIYASLVHRRERRRRRRDAFARLRALGTVLTHRPMPLRLDGEPVESHVLLVSSNAYALEVLSLGERERLDEGLLHVYGAGGLLPAARDERTGTRFTVDSPRGRVRAAVDGEPATLATPIELRIEPRALRVLVPAG
ncbi:MAG TPA: diacylglycerol kinase family protein [Gaiellaceae bacterium]|jgi:diacylglycerol kinase family enzyme